MIFESYEEYNNLVEEVSKELSKKPKKEKPKDDFVKDDPVGGSIPLDDVLPPSKGHTVGDRVPNTSANNQPYYGGPWLEHSLEERLHSLLKEISEDNDQTVNAQQDARQGKVGRIAPLGHAGNASNTKAAKERVVADPMSRIKKAGLVQGNPESDESEEEGGEPSEEMKSDMQALGINPDEASSSL